MGIGIRMNDAVFSLLRLLKVQDLTAIIGEKNET